QLTVFEYGIALRFITGQAVEADERNRPLAVRTKHAYNGVEGGQCNGHVRRMCGDARIRCTQDGQGAVITLASGTAAARYALITRLGDMLEVNATRTLQQVRAGRSRVAQLAGGPREQRRREHGTACADPATASQVAGA